MIITTLNFISRKERNALKLKYSLVLKNGRIIDPANGVDMIGDVGIFDGKIADSGKQLDVTEAQQIVDLEGRWIIPGVIDPHAHVSSWLGGEPGLNMMAREGVTTALDMAGPVSGVLENVKNHGSGINIACLDAFSSERETPNNIFSDEEIEKRLENSLENGAYGIKILGGHYPLTPNTTKRVIRKAAEKNMYVAFHVGTTENGSNLNGFKEAINLADGYPIHIAHINSYCRGAIKHPLEELHEAIEILENSPNAWSESYLSPFNGTSGKCENGEILSEVTKQCCRKGGYADDEKGLAEAILGGFSFVVFPQGGENLLVTGTAGHDYWLQQKTDVTLSFPVNSPEIQIALATLKNNKNVFYVDALSTDGGGIPRNTMIRQGLSLVQFGAFTPSDLTRKLSTNAAAMLGLKSKGHLTQGADGDITILDPTKGKAYMSVVAGKIVMLDNIVLGKGGTIITTTKGKEKVESAGLPVFVNDSKKLCRS